MKKKFLSFILAICLILSCTFAFSACGDKPPSGGPEDLAGKTIGVLRNSAELDWDKSISISSIESGENGVYFIDDLTLEQFVEQFYESNPAFIIDLGRDSSVSNVEQAKTALRNVAVGTILSRNPIIKFSVDGTTATTYAETDTNFETPLKTYTVQKSGTDELFIYGLYEGQVERIRITCDYDSIDVSCFDINTDEYLCFKASFDLNNYQDANILLIDSAGNEREFRLDQCDIDYQPHTLTFWIENTVLTYIVK